MILILLTKTLLSDLIEEKEEEEEEKEEEDEEEEEEKEENSVNVLRIKSNIDLEIPVVDSSYFLCSSQLNPI